jgi:hypothetical protein
MPVYSRLTQSGTAICLLVFATIVTVAFGPLIVKSWISSDWPSVSGTVDSAEIERPDSSWRVNIKYHFDVGGKRIESDRYELGEKPFISGASVSSLGNEMIAQAVHRGCPSGQAVRVFYNPHNPSEAVLSPGLNGAGVVIALFLLGLYLVGFSWIFKLARLRRRQ